MLRTRFPDTVSAGGPVELELRLGAVTLRGSSVAARATAFAVPEAGAALDLGRLSQAVISQPVVLVSHAHLDHLSAVLAYLNVRARFHAGRPPLLVLPEEGAGPLRRALEVMPGLDSVRKRFDLAEIVRGAVPGDVVTLPGGTAEAFALDHSVPALGWRIGDGGGRPALVYALDSGTAPFSADPSLLDAGASVVECTFVERNRRVAARMSKHAHLRDWEELAPRLTCDHLVLAHLPPVGAERLRELLAPLAEAFPGTLVPWAAGS